MNATATFQSAKTIATIRQCLRYWFGARRYRITCTGEIHVYGEMPNSKAVGWWFFGWIGDSTTMERLGVDA